MKFLVIQQKMIGDVLTSSIICDNLKQNFPDSEVHYLINRFTLPVVDGHPKIDKFILFEDEYRKSKIKFYKFLKYISTQNYTHVFDAYAKLESLLITRFSKANHRYGFKKKYSTFYYTKSTEIQSNSVTEAGTAIENRLRLFKLMPGTSIYNNKPKIYLSDEELEIAKSSIDKAGLDYKDIVMISSLGSGDTKTYPLHYMAKILDKLAEKTAACFILNFMPSQQQDIDELVNLCKSRTQQQLILNIEMRSLRQFMAICKYCKAIIGNEGGAINIAKALDIPSFSIFSPWIIKEGWNSFEINHPNISVHLSDFKTDLFVKNDIKFIKQNADKFYQQFKPELFQDKLDQFIDDHVS